MTRIVEHQNPRFAKKIYVNPKRLPHVPKNRLYSKSKDPENLKRCIAVITDTYGFQFNRMQCEYKRRADSQDGEYCGRHDPIKINAYNEECRIEEEWRNNQWKKNAAKQERRKQLRAAAEKFLQQCADGGVNDVQGLAIMIIEDPAQYLEETK